MGPTIPFAFEYDANPVTVLRLPTKVGFVLPPSSSLCIELINVFFLR